MRSQELHHAALHKAQGELNQFEDAVTFQSKVFPTYVQVCTCCDAEMMPHMLCSLGHCM